MRDNESTAKECEKDRPKMKERNNDVYCTNEFYELSDNVLIMII